MKTLSYTQGYFLCAVNDKHNISSSSRRIALIVSGIIELLSHKYIVEEKKDKLVAGKEWDDSLSYLEPLYKTIVTSKKPLSIGGIVNSYSEKRFKELFVAIGDSLVELDCADKLSKKGLRKVKIIYVPKAKTIASIIERVRTELLGGGTMTDEIIYLAALLDIDGLIRYYFSKDEMQVVKARLREAKGNLMQTSILRVIDEITAIIITSSIVVSE